VQRRGRTGNAATDHQHVGSQQRGVRRASAPSRAGKRGVAWVRSKGSWLRRRWAAAGQFAGAAASGAFTAGAAVSLPRIQIRMGAAMYTVEYTPEIMPMIIAKENASRSEPEP